MNAKSANQLEEFICSKHLTIKKDFHVEKISVPESSGEVWRRICHGAASAVVELFVNVICSLNFVRE